MGDDFPQLIKRHQSTQFRTSVNTKEDLGGGRKT